MNTQARMVVSCAFLLVLISSTNNLEDYVRHNTARQEEVWEYEIVNNQPVEKGQLRFRNSYDSNHHLIESIKYNDSGSRPDWWYYRAFVYDGSLLKEEYYFREDKIGNRLLSAKLTYEYSPEGTITQAQWYQSDPPVRDSVTAHWVPGDIWQYQYDTNKRMKETVSLSKERVNWVSRYQYDSMGRNIRTVFVNSTDTTLSDTEYYSYDSSGNKVGWVHVQTNDSSHYSYGYRYQGKFMIEEIGYTPEGRRSERTEYTYNEAGDLTESRKYGWWDTLELVQRHRYIRK